MGSGTIFREVIAAADLLKADWGVEADIWGAPELQRTRPQRPGRRALEPAASDGKPRRVARRAQKLAGAQGPVIAATDYIRMFAEQIRPFVPKNTYVTLGTDGFGVRTRARTCATSSRWIGTGDAGRAEGAGR